jgi:hypothetical protein
MKSKVSFDKCISIVFLSTLFFFHRENYEEEWKKQRLQIKEVLKKRQKSAVRSQKKRAGN